MSENQKFRNVCFTWNNYPEDWENQLTEKLPQHNYYVAGKEVGDSGTPHIQGYVEFNSPAKFTTLKKKFPTWHIEKRKGTSTQAADYCKKDGDWKETGTISNPGKRNDLEAVRDILKTGGERDVVAQATSFQSVKYAQVYLKVMEKKRNFKPLVIWLYGKAGTGKTRTAHFDAFRRGYFEDIHLQCGQGKWWEGYDGHKVVIMDDVRSDFCSYNRMLNLLDRYECRLENKGGSRQMLARVIYITAPVHPEELWATTEEKAQLLRRIDVIQEIISCVESNIHKGNGISQEKPHKYPEEDIQEEVNESECSDEEVRSEGTTQSGIEDSMAT